MQKVIPARVLSRVFSTWCLLGLTGCMPPRVLRNQPSDGRYLLKGEVIAIRQPEHEVVVKHEAITGFMAAMTMPYTVKNGAELVKLAEGDLISGDVVVQNGDFWLENVRVTHHGKSP